MNLKVEFVKKMSDDGDEITSIDSDGIENMV